jgi:peptidase E
MDEFIKVMVLNQNATYIGASAGAMLAGCSFELALDFDKNRAGIDDFSGFDIIKGKTAIIPHYTKKEFEKYVRYY